MRFTEGHKDILTLLIDKKCDVDILDNNSQTPLHIACYKGNVALVEILLRNKCECDVNISDNNSQTLLSNIVTTFVCPPSTARLSGVLFKLSHWSTTHLFLSNISTSAT
jgi:hypothetical protein